jgi:NDP-sugar pyrophosphorylase family protein
MSPIRRGGIIAAGEGSRLRAAGLAAPKPLVEVGGRPLIGRVFDNFRAAGIGQVAVIFNEEGAACVAWLNDNAADFDVDLTVKSTPSSYASFEIVATRLRGARCVISTVDAWIAPAGFVDFVRSAEAMPDDAVVLGVTELIDDEKPLLVDLDAASGRVVSLGETSGCYATAGVYVLPAVPAFAEGREFGRLRDYLGWLVRSGHHVFGVNIPNVIDVDRASDIATAERLIDA